MGRRHSRCVQLSGLQVDEGSVDEHVRSVQLNLRITPRMKQRITALAKAQKLSVTELIIGAFDAYALDLPALDVVRYQRVALRLARPDVRSALARQSLT